MNREEIFYRAMPARDPRFDGKFFIAVKTTGIYCRPICPAQPKPQNILFFATAHLAERAGFRPCLRCRPEAAPDSPAWLGKSAVVRRAMKVIHHQDTGAFNENEFAGLFGVSARHLRRLFHDEIGKTPKQIAFDNRLNLARKLVTESAIPLTEIAYASGFRSVRRFNDCFKDRFSKSPRAVRRHRTVDNTSITVTLSYRPPFDFKGLLHFYESHRIGNLERFSAESMQRIFSLEGKIGRISVSDQPERSRLAVEVDYPNYALLPCILARVKAMFDLSADPIVTEKYLSRNLVFKRLFNKHQGLRLPSGWDGFEVAVATILGQVVSVSHARRLVGTLVERLGEDTGLHWEGEKVKLFPSPEKIARADLSFLKTTSARKQSLRSFALAISEKRISLSPAQDVASFKAKIREIPGLGPWTANYLALRVLHDADAFPETDLILKRALTKHAKSTIDEMSPWRGYAAILLWREHGGLSAGALAKAERKNK